MKQPAQLQFPGLQIAEDMRYQKQEWLIQRIVWVFLYALLLAIALGMLGNGPLSQVRAGQEQHAIQLQYERFLRQRSPDSLKLLIDSSSSEVRVAIDTSYIRKIEIEKVTPEPTEVIAGMNATTYVFSADPSGPMHAEFYFRPQKVGKLEGWIAMKGKPRLHFNQFVYP